MKRTSLLFSILPLPALAMALGGCPKSSKMMGDADPAPAGLQV